MARFASFCVCSGHQKIWLFNPIVICMSPGSKLLSLVSLYMRVWTVRPPSRICPGGPSAIVRTQKQNRAELRTGMMVSWLHVLVVCAPSGEQIFAYFSQQSPAPAVQGCNEIKKIYPWKYQTELWNNSEKRCLLVLGPVGPSVTGQDAAGKSNQVH